MKKIIFILLFMARYSLQAQNSDLYNLVVNVQQNHFTATSIYPIGSAILVNTTNKSLQGSSHTGQQVKTLTPIVVFDGKMLYNGIQTETLVRNILNSYTLNQIAGIDYWQDINYSTTIYGLLGENGVIFVYSKNYTATNPSIRSCFKISFENGQIVEKKKKEGK